jgi:hypothetical protein
MYAAQYVYKTVQTTTTPEMAYGTLVHRQFEDYVKKATPLPRDLQKHKQYIDTQLAPPAKPHTGYRVETERKVGLSRAMEPVGFFDKGVWYRGIIDASRYHVANDGVVSAKLLDYKTGKVRDDKRQLKLSALYCFAEGVQVVDTRYYWAQTMTETRAVYTIDQQASLWNEFVPDLHNYAQAYKTEVWTAKPSGLCNGWCPVTDCQFWRPKRK